jgi:hypothetical protein
VVYASYTHTRIDRAEILLKAENASDFSPKRVFLKAGEQLTVKPDVDISGCDEPLYQWDFDRLGTGGEYERSGPDTVTHSYARDGLYIVSLTVTCGECQDQKGTAQISVRVGELEIYQVETPSNLQDENAGNSFISTDYIDVFGWFTGDDLDDLPRVGPFIDWKVKGINSGNANSGIGNPPEATDTAVYRFKPAPVDRPAQGNENQNAPLQYDVEAKVNKNDLLTTNELTDDLAPLPPIKQDTIDILRQEYVDFRDEYSKFKSQIPVPTRSVFVPPFRPDVITGPYPLILDDGLSELYEALKSAFRTKIVELHGQSFDREYELTMSSGYRNPQYNISDAVGSDYEHSFHVRGRALDVEIPSVPGKTIKQVCEVLRDAAKSLQGSHTVLVEYGAKDLKDDCDNNAAGPGLGRTHVHVHKN